MDYNTLTKLHETVNKRLYEKYPLLSMADLSKHPRGHYNRGDLEFIINTYEEIKNADKPEAKHGYAEYPNC